MGEIRFRNFTPKDEELVHLVVPPVGVQEVLRDIELELNDQIATAKSGLESIGKLPTKPNWDLKRQFRARNKRLDVQTAKAVAKLCGKCEEDSLEEESQEMNQVNDEVHADVNELSSDDDDGEFTALGEKMADISRYDDDLPLDLPE